MSQTKLLIAVSSPWASQKLSNPIADLARRLEAEAVIAHVAKQRDEDESESDAHKRGEETLQVFLDAMKDAGVKADSVMLFSDDIPKAILKTAQSHDCTMVVIGLPPAKDRSFIHKLLGKEIAQELVRQADLPVILFPASWHGAI